MFGHSAIVARNHRADVPRNNLDPTITDRDALAVRSSGRKRFRQMPDEIGHHDDVWVIVELPIAKVADCKERTRRIDLQSEENLLHTGRSNGALPLSPRLSLLLVIAVLRESSALLTFALRMALQIRGIKSLIAKSDSRAASRPWFCTPPSSLFGMFVLTPTSARPLVARGLFYQAVCSFELMANGSTMDIF